MIKTEIASGFQL